MGLSITAGKVTYYQSSHHGFNIFLERMKKLVVKTIIDFLTDATGKEEPNKGYINRESAQKLSMLLERMLNKLNSNSDRYLISDAHAILAAISAAYQLKKDVVINW
jgi:hypothetical protein